MYFETMLRLRPLISMLVVLVCFFLGACDNKLEHSITAQSVPLVNVDGEVIYDSDVDFLIEKMLRSDDQLKINNTLRQKILDSLIASRAMKQQVEKQLSAVELTRIEESVKAYKEELFVKEYLQKNVVPEQVTMEMVQHYYNENIGDYSRDTVSDFELLKAPSNLTDVQRDQLLNAMTDVKKISNWESESKMLQQKYSLQYQKGRYKKGLLNEAFDQVFANLEQGQTSDFFYIDGELHLIRITHISNSMPQSLAVVSEEIHKKLTTQKLREAVKAASDKARSQAKVEVLAELK